MKITHFSNSFMSISSQGETFVCDPWVGKANASGWQSFPEFSSIELAEYLADAKWIYVSHLHDDHFHPETLKVHGLLDREFIIKRFSQPILRERLKRLGVTRIREIDAFEVVKIGPFEISIFPQLSSNSSGLEDDVNFDLDTSIAIKADGKVFFNQVDNPLSFEDLKNVHAYISQKMGAIDVACLMSGAASEYPHLFLGVDHANEKKRIVDRSLLDLAQWLSLLNPQYYFPAGGTYLIPGWLSQFAANVAQPTYPEIVNFLSDKRLSTQCISLEGGRFLEWDSESQKVEVGSSISPVVFEREVATEIHKVDPYVYEHFDAPEWSVLTKYLDQARSNWEEKVVRKHYEITQSIIFEVYRPLSLKDGKSDVSKHLGTFRIHAAKTPDRGVLSIHIDQRALFACVVRKLVWNGVLGALCLYERTPNRHYPTDFFSLNFLTITDQQVEQLVDSIEA
ncbi:MAG TPA: hypothetical protein DHV01_06130 [Rhodoferax sp.]|uniref:MBL fold metallo-hydrolase n=1 Tax=Rhodoferax sp. TaxID=50421 RepID=UPI000ED17278|nr:MBL fold metallo-hydrolase [Rhodoferax sp.]HCX81166.1 hypothetical protein [Rhodoferax sp.]